MPAGRTGTTPTTTGQPPAARRYSFDLEKAGQMLTAAGYPLKNGVRVDKQGKPIKLRLWARRRIAGTPVGGKLIAGWFDSLGLEIDLQVVTTAALERPRLQHGQRQAGPDYDMFLWGWDGNFDPNFLLSMSYLTSQIETGATRAGRTRSTTASTLKSRATMDPAHAQAARLADGGAVLPAGALHLILVYP